MLGPWSWGRRGDKGAGSPLSSLLGHSRALCAGLGGHPLWALNSPGLEQRGVVTGQRQTGFLPARSGLLGSVLLPGPVVFGSGSPWPPDAGNQVAHVV